MNSHSDKNTKQPKLRYPCFTGEWKQKKIADFLLNLDKTIE